MTKEEAIKILEYTLECVDEETPKGASEAEAIPMAIEALEGVCFDEWCDDCKEYDTEKKCCPRFNRVIRGAMNREPSDDGTLEVKVEDATKVGRVLISDDKHRGGLYYPDEDEPKGEDLISRQAAIDALYDKGSSMTAWGELLAMKWSDIQKCIEQLPSADRPQKVIAQITFDKEKLREIVKEAVERFKEEYEIADRPRGSWHYSDGKPATIGQSFGVICDQCGAESEYCTNFCGECGADMRGEDE